MPRVHVSRLAYGHSDSVPLFHDLDLCLDEGWTGLVGANGAGKTTLLRLLAGELRPDEGTIRIDPRDARVLLCRQDVHVRDPSIDALATSDDGEAHRLRALLRLEPDSLARWDTLSPGERKRWQIGAALHADPDVLLLDEPGNHVDAEARAILVEALAGFVGVGVLVSHDRALLDALCSSTLRIERGEARFFSLPFAEARRAWEAEAAAERAAWEQARDEQAKARRRLADQRRKLDAVEASRSAGRRMKSHKDGDARGISADFRAARAERAAGRAIAIARERHERAVEELPEKPPARALGGSVFVGYERARTPILAVVERARIEVAGVPLLTDVRLTVRRDDRLRVTGPNGAGKTTLLRALLEEARLPPERLLFLPQDLSPDEARGVVDEVRALPPDVRGRVMQIVAALGVEPSRVLATSAPSPGEARKLALALGLGRHVWALVLDEPTNHLDLPSIERLEEALAAFPGALVLVTHDDHFAAACTTTTVRVGDGRVLVR